MNDVRFKEKLTCTVTDDLRLKQVKGQNCRICADLSFYTKSDDVVHFTILQYDK